MNVESGQYVVPIQIYFLEGANDVGSEDPEWGTEERIAGRRKGVAVGDLLRVRTPPGEPTTFPQTSLAWLGEGKKWRRKGKGKGRKLKGKEGEEKGKRGERKKRGGNRREGECWFNNCPHSHHKSWLRPCENTYYKRNDFLTALFVLF